jgi:superfamily II DNA or RNA helicase
MTKEESIRIKTEIQDRFVSQSLSEQNILFKFYTGFGKTRSAVERIRQSRSIRKWLVLVPKIVLIKNFLKDYKKWGGDVNKD